VTAALDLLRSAAAVPLAELDDVSVRRGDATLVGAVDWTIRAGERWVVIGANGAGKTTLLQILAGSTRPTQGNVALLGEELDQADLDDLLPRIGWASAAVSDRVPVIERVLDVVLTASYAAIVRGNESYDDRDLSRARQLLARVGCRDLDDRLFGTLSEGERKRVLLARALMTDPELLLLDEPAAGLDLGGREALLCMLGRLATDVTAPAQVLVTHHVEEIPAGYTHAMLLRHGQVVIQGPIHRVLDSGTLSAAFGLPLHVTYADGRWNARSALTRLG
jgi:iron complex transport system ATP-binding protein